jgi:methionine-rich copper-binding protein CopC
MYANSARYTLRNMSLTPSRWIATVGLALSLLVLLAFPPKLLAHAILVRSTPARHATLDGRKLPIELHFNSRVDGARSRVTLILASDATASHPLPLQTLTQTAPDTLLSEVDELAKGDYSLHWIVLASDGHISRGEIPFSIK